jgi:hypothetical protein
MRGEGNSREAGRRDGGDLPSLTRAPNLGSGPPHPSAHEGLHMSGEAHEGEDEAAAEREALRGRGSHGHHAAGSVWQLAS